MDALSLADPTVGAATNLDDAAGAAALEVAGWCDIRDAVLDLEAAVAAPAQGPGWVSGVGAGLRRLADDLAGHAAAEDGPGRAISRSAYHPFGQIVEGPDRPPEQRRLAPKQVAFDALDLAPIGNDEERVPVERGEVSVEQARDLAGVRRADEQGQRHPTYPRGWVGAERSPQRPRPLRRGSRPPPAPPERCGVYLDGRLRTAPATGGRTARHAAGTAVTEIGDLGTAPRVRIREPERGALAFTNLGAAIVADEHCLFCQRNLPG